MFPVVGSTIVPPGLSNPFRSASSITASPILSLTLRPGLDASSFTQTVATIPAVTWLSRTSGVLPTVSSTLAEIFDMRFAPGYYQLRNGLCRCCSTPTLPDQRSSLYNSAFPISFTQSGFSRNPEGHLKDCFGDAGGECDR